MIHNPGVSRILSAFHHRNYALFITAQTPAMVTLWLQRLAVGWLTWELTHSPTWLGIIAFADMMPIIIISPFAGALTDRVNPLTPLRLSQIAMTLQALALFLFTFSGAMTIWILLGLAIISGANQAFSAASRHTLVPNLVPRQDLPAAIAIDSAIFNAARLVGPALAGIVIATAGIAWAFAINVAGFTVYTVILYRLRVTPPERAPSPHRNILGDVAEGWNYVVRHPGIGPILLLLSILAIVGRPIMDLLPGFAADVFQRDAVGLAWLTSSMGLGAMIGATWLAMRGGVAGLTNVVVVTTLALALALLAFSSTDDFWLSLPFMAIVGFGIAVTNTATQTLIQTAVHGPMRGRVMSLVVVIYRGLPAFGALILGRIAEDLGLQISLAGGAVICLFAWVWATGQRRRIIAALEGSRPPQP